MSDSGFLAYTAALDTLFRDGDPDVAAKAQEAGNVAVTQEWVRTFGRGDIAAAAEFFAPDIALEIVAPPVLDAVIAQGDTLRGIHRYRFDGGLIALVEEFLFPAA